MRNIIGSYWVGYIKQQGIFHFMYLCVRKLFFLFFKYSFQECGSIFILGSYSISGKTNISIGKLSTGDRFRMEAILFMGESEFSPDLRIGKNVSFGNDIHIACINRIEIGNNVLAGSHIYITDHDHGIYAGSEYEHSSPATPPAQRTLISNASVSIGDNVFIGEYVTILKGVSIGRGTVIGAGSIVTQSIPANSIAVGNPARVVKIWDESESKWKSFRQQQIK